MGRADDGCRQLRQTPPPQPRLAVLRQSKLCSRRWWGQRVRWGGGVAARQTAGGSARRAAANGRVSGSAPPPRTTSTWMPTAYRNARSSQRRPHSPRLPPPPSPTTLCPTSGVPSGSIAFAMRWSSLSRRSWRRTARAARPPRTRCPATRTSPSWLPPALLSMCMWPPTTRRRVSCASRRSATPACSAVCRWNTRRRASWAARRPTTSRL